MLALWHTCTLGGAICYVTASVNSPKHTCRLQGGIHQIFEFISQVLYNVCVLISVYMFLRASWKRPVLNISIIGYKNWQSLYLYSCTKYFCFVFVFTKWIANYLVSTCFMQSLNRCIFLYFGRWPSSTPTPANSQKDEVLLRTEPKWSCWLAMATVGQTGQIQHVNFPILSVVEERHTNGKIFYHRNLSDLRSVLWDMKMILRMGYQVNTLTNRQEV